MEIVLPCGSTKLSSSQRLPWTGLLVERHLAHAQPAEQSFFPTLLIELASGRTVASGERNIGRGEFRRYQKLPGAINVYTEGVRPALRPTTTTELTVCAIDWRLVEQANEERGRSIRSRPQEALGFQDAALAGIVSLLEIEGSQGNPSGRLYSDHLTQALVLKLLTRENSTSFLPARRWDLPRKSLQRVLERMHADLSADHDLDTLARESGYSRNHFIQVFRSAVGATPHQYLLQLRLEHAKGLLTSSSQGIAEISLSCGFQQQGNFSKAFRRAFGASPVEYRKYRSF